MKKAWTTGAHTSRPFRIEIPGTRSGSGAPGNEPSGKHPAMGGHESGVGGAPGGAGAGGDPGGSGAGGTGTGGLPEGAPR